MTRSISPQMTNYFVYLPDRLEHGPWECTATSVGHQNVLAGSSYPPRRHPVDHYFTWENGRVLNAYQLVYITNGRGYFESEISDRKFSIEGGSLLILFPGVWHRYSPDRKTGWVGLAPFTWRERLAGHEKQEGRSPTPLSYRL